MKEWAVDQLKRKGVSEEIQKQFEAIIDAFDRQGHSGFSASYALGYINMYIKDGYDKVKGVLDRIYNKGKDGDEQDNRMQSLITNNIFEIIDLMQDFGMSQEDKKDVIRILDFKPIIPLTGADDEWSESYSDKTQQNKLCSEVFRSTGDNSTAYWSCGRIYSDNGGHSWFTGRHDLVQSSVPITFPFYVPESRERVYLNADCSCILTDPAEIKALYDKWEEDHKEA